MTVTPAAAALRKPRFEREVNWSVPNGSDYFG
jgi:hypothetical protein